MHAEKRAGPGGQNNGGTFPGSQANSDSSQPVTTALYFLNRPFLYSLNENNDIIVLCMRMGIGTAERSQLFIKELLVSHKPSWYSMISTCYKAFVFSQLPFFYIH